VAYWHSIALTMHQRDYSRTELNKPLTDPTQPGPCYTTRAMAMVHLAIYDGLVGATQENPTYLDYDLPVLTRA
jgi:hypothetical protein